VKLADVAGIFSRKFIVGFFIPAFFATFALSLLVNRRALPRPYLRASGGAKVLIVGAVALLVGLLLSGLHYSVLRFLEGYWLIDEPQGSPWARLARATRFVQVKQRAGRRMEARWTREYERLEAMTTDPEGSPERTRAALELHDRYPATARLVLPTRFGNVIRSFETHPRRRYGLDGIATWPRIALLLSDPERAELEDAATDLAFWVNSLVMVGVGGALLFAERLWHRPGEAAATVGVELAIVAVVVILCNWMYNHSVAAAIRWGEPIRAAFDVHRLDLYDKLGVRQPRSQGEENEIARAVNRLLLFAEPLPDRLRGNTASAISDKQPEAATARESQPVYVTAEAGPIEKDSNAPSNDPAAAAPAERKSTGAR
jgi:hypothetical protein